jgi:hypothetical protein
MAGLFEEYQRLFALLFGDKDVLAIESTYDKHANALRGERRDDRKHDASCIEREWFDTSQAAPGQSSIDIVWYTVLQADKLSAHRPHGSRHIGQARWPNLGPGRLALAWQYRSDRVRLAM